MIISIRYEYLKPYNCEQIICWLVSLINSISTFVGYLMPKSSLLKNSSDIIYYLTSWGDKVVHIFPGSISLKLNIISQLEFKLAYLKTTVLDFNYYATGTPKSFILDRNTWYHITMCKKLLNNYTKNVNINIQCIWFPNL